MDAGDCNFKSEVARHQGRAEAACPARSLVGDESVEGDGKGDHYLGIYELGEKTRKMCFAPPGKERPTEFTSMPDNEHILVTFEREKAK